MTATTPVLTDSKTLDEVVNCLIEQQNIFEILIRAATRLYSSIIY